MTTWKYRGSASLGQEYEIPSANLLPLLQQGILGPSHQFLAPGEMSWITAPEALYRLLVPSASSPPTETPPASPSLVENIPVGRLIAAVPVTTSQPPSQPIAAPIVKPLTPQTSRGVGPLPPNVQSAVHIPLVASPPQPAAIPSPQRWVGPAANSPTAKGAAREAPLLLITDENVRPRLLPRRDNDEEELEMTPMIDVTFLLLIFFMVSSTVSQFASLQLPESVSGDAENPSNRVVLVVDFPDGENDQVAERFTGARPILFTDVRLRLEKSDELLDAVSLEQQLRTSFQKEGKTQLIVQAHRKMPASVVREVLNIGRQAGALKTLVGVTITK